MFAEFHWTFMHSYWTNGHHAKTHILCHSRFESPSKEKKNENLCKRIYALNIWFVVLCCVEIQRILFAWMKKRCELINVLHCFIRIHFMSERLWIGLQISWEPFLLVVEQQICLLNCVCDGLLCAICVYWHFHTAFDPILNTFEFMCLPYDKANHKNVFFFSLCISLDWI